MITVGKVNSLDNMVKNSKKNDKNKPAKGSPEDDYYI